MAGDKINAHYFLHYHSVGETLEISVSFFDAIFICFVFFFLFTVQLLLLRIFIRPVLHVLKVHRNHQWILLKCSFWFSRSEMEPKSSISSKLQGDVRMLVQESHFKQQEIREGGSFHTFQAALQITWLYFILFLFFFNFILFLNFT